MRIIALLFAPVIALLVTGCADTHTPYRFRLKVELETPSGLMTASSVIEVIHTEVHFGMGQGGKYRDTIHGVAPMFDLPGRGTLIAALKYNSRGTTGKPKGYHEIPKNVDTVPFDIDKGEHRSVLFEPFELSQYQYPQFVWIRLGGAAKDAFPLLPREFAAHLGNGFSIKRITVEPTDDPLIEHVENPPAWLRVWIEERRIVVEELRKHPDRRQPYKRLTPEEYNKFRLNLGQIQTGRL